MNESLEQRWHALRAWRQPFRPNDQAVVIAGTNGAKSTLVATLTLPVPSLVALDEKASLTLPDARIVELPFLPHERANGARLITPEFSATLANALAWRERPRDNRVIIRVHALNIDDADVHDQIFRAAFTRGNTVIWVDEITATGSSAHYISPWLKACSARGRTRGIGLWTCSQSAFGLVPVILRRNATYVIFGSSDPQDVADIHRQDIEIATGIPRKSGRFILYEAGDPTPYRLYLPIPPALKGWTAP